MPERADRFSTRCAHAGLNPFENNGVVNPPIYHASTILFETYAHMKAASRAPAISEAYYYGRVGTPTTRMTQDACAALDGALGCVLFSSGITAISALLTAMLQPGDKLLMTDSAYGPTRAFCDGYLARIGVETTYYDPLIGGEIARLIDKRVRLIFMESPGSLTFEVQDVPAIVSAAKQHGITTAIDNSWATPFFFNPLDHGVDLHVQAATKYLAGHSDVMCGVVSTRNEKLLNALRSFAFDFGLTLAPDDCYLLQRGLRTLPLRLQAHSENAMALAQWLQSRAEVGRLLHPAFPSCPGHDVFKRLYEGPSGLFACILPGATEEAVMALVDDLRLWRLGYSWGGFESLVLPIRPSNYRSLPSCVEDNWVLRLHVGLEDLEDLKADLAQGFDRYRPALQRKAA